MTPEQIIELADDCGASVYKYQSVARVSIEFGSAALVKFAKLIEAATREECASVIEQDLWPIPTTDYIRQDNDGIRRLAEKIRSGT